MPHLTIQKKKKQKTTNTPQKKRKRKKKKKKQGPQESDPRQQGAVTLKGQKRPIKEQEKGEKPRVKMDGSQSGLSLDT